MRTYTLINYFDVWGNEVDGWSVNDACSEADGITITDDATEQDIIDYLYNIEFFKTNDLEKFDVEYYGDFIEISEKETQKPLCSLRPND